MIPCVCVHSDLLITGGQRDDCLLNEWTDYFPFYHYSLSYHYWNTLYLVFFCFWTPFYVCRRVLLSIKPIVFICLHCFSCLVFLASCEWFSRGLFDLNHERLILTLFISLDVFVAIEWRIETHLRWDWRCVSFCCYCVLILKKTIITSKIITVRSVFLTTTSLTVF